MRFHILENVHPSKKIEKLFEILRFLENANHRVSGNRSRIPKSEANFQIFIEAVLRGFEDDGFKFLVNTGTESRGVNFENFHFDDMGIVGYVFEVVDFKVDVIFVLPIKSEEGKW